MSSKKAKVGVLAIQGAVKEHIDAINRCGAIGKEIRYVNELEECDGLILPGGESTALAIIGEETGLFDGLRKWVKSDKPVWGTCAGMILLSNHAILQKEGGQTLVGGMDVDVCRNFFGSQVYSTEIDMDMAWMNGGLSEVKGRPVSVAPTVAVEEGEKVTAVQDDSSDIDSNQPFKAVFIRAPALLRVGLDVTVLAKITAKPHRSAVKEVARVLGDAVKLNDDGEVTEPVSVIVAAKQKNLLSTAFHPELTGDDRWHAYFINEMCIEGLTRV